MRHPSMRRERGVKRYLNRNHYFRSHLPLPQRCLQQSRASIALGRPSAAAPMPS
ncbi:hypothetical protein CPB84DRAFT_1798119 [Gymnopilus junonius]|uniref:Uncharacterized protein n=1 Tax=Gymnopilus junonius TaxID=109634 RepID=A0A9P5NAB8_GYMJU|nr:hypothetical protein CPB84DRAFT_1798119 [Gymnopilus junonius]